MDGPVTDALGTAAVNFCGEGAPVPSTIYRHYAHIHPFSHASTMTTTRLLGQASCVCLLSSMAMSGWGHSIYQHHQIPWSTAMQPSQHKTKQTRTFPSAARSSLSSSITTQRQRTHARTHLGDKVHAHHGRENNDDDLASKQSRGGTSGCVDGWMHGWTDGRTDGRVDGWMNGRMGGE